MALTPGSVPVPHRVKSLTSSSFRQGIQSYIPVIGDIHTRSPLAYRATRGAVGVTNAIQMGIAEAYIRGIELPDPMMRAFFDVTMPLILKYFPVC